ncbi:Prohead protease [uncultured Caudovirales phage]|uniref:Prohead protease n=1 Tax=uncultured Caudovirales phage TaxID=2100421 RepID=A0A6J5S5J5_9CAUD|nr:Prohead protease [uncultured Caudovirales phage]
MPYGISQEQTDCANWATVKQETDGSYTTIGCHESKEDAIDQMIVVSMAEDIEPLGEIRAEGDMDTEQKLDSPDKSGSMSERNDDFIEAIDQVMAILTQVKDEYESGDTVEPDEMTEPAESPEMSEIRAEIDLSAPEFMRASARRGLDLHEQGLSGDGLVPATVADARRMAAGEISEGKWRKIGAWIARHIGDLEAIEDSEITAGLVAMLLWGGGSTKASALRAQTYAERIVARLDEQQTRCADDKDATMIEPMKDQAAAIEHRWCVTGSDERRVAFSTLEMREVGEGNQLIGYAAVFDSPSEPMPFTEFVKRGAFTKTIKDGADVRLLIDHEGVPLARTKSGTLTLTEDDRGLRVVADLDPANPDAARVMSAMRRGDLSQMSFAFRTIKDAWSDDRSVRELREVQLFDVSVVTFPAYEQTMAELRNAEMSVTMTSTTDVSVRKAQIALARHR